MIETVLAKKEVSFNFAVTVKALVAAGVVLLAALLPQLVHLALGASGGAAWLPMYLPVLIGGCVLGWKWGLGVGILSPLFSFCITWAFGDPMPAAVRLPYYGGGACRFCGGVGRVLSKNRAQRMDGVPRRAVGGGFGKVCVFDFGGGLSKRISADGRRRLVADSIGASGTCIAGGRRAFYRDGLGGIALTG